MQNGVQPSTRWTCQLLYYRGQNGATADPYQSMIYSGPVPRNGGPAKGTVRSNVEPHRTVGNSKSSGVVAELRNQGEHAPHFPTSQHPSISAVKPTSTGLPNSVVSGTSYSPLPSHWPMPAYDGNSSRRFQADLPYLHHFIAGIW
jgi:hypothetical protein